MKTINQEFEKHKEQNIPLKKKDKKINQNINVKNSKLVEFPKNLLKKNQDFKEKLNLIEQVEIFFQDNNFNKISINFISELTEFFKIKINDINKEVSKFSFS